MYGYCSFVLGKVDAIYSLAENITLVAGLGLAVQEWLAGEQETRDIIAETTSFLQVAVQLHSMGNPAILRSKRQDWHISHLLPLRQTLLP